MMSFAFAAGDSECVASKRVRNADADSLNAAFEQRVRFIQYGHISSAGAKEHSARPCVWNCS
jgi:hypothetical protein